MKMHLKRLAGAAAVLLASLGLSGCSGDVFATPSAISVLDEDQTTADELPTDASGFELDAATSHFLWSGDDVSAYAARSDNGYYCVVVYSDTRPDGVAGCGPTLPITLSIGGSTEYKLIADDGDPTEGANGAADWTKLADNLFST